MAAAVQKTGCSSRHGTAGNFGLIAIFRKVRSFRSRQVNRPCQQDAKVPPMAGTVSLAIDFNKFIRIRTFAQSVWVY